MSRSGLEADAKSIKLDTNCDLGSYDMLCIAIFTTIDNIDHLLFSPISSRLEPFYSRGELSLQTKYPRTCLQIPY